MSGLDAVRRRFASHRPALIDPADHGRAAVGVVLREREGDFDVLFIERAERAGDPWSGHMAFPGGRVDARDAGPRAAVEREVREEVGVSLRRAELLGRLDDVQGRHYARLQSLVISAFVYRVSRRAPLETNEEVREALWVEDATLLDPAHHVTYAAPGMGLGGPGVVVGDPARHVVWGLTYRLLQGFFGVLGQRFPREPR